MFFDPNQRFNSSMQIVFELSSRYKHVTLNLNSACLLYTFSKRTIQSVPQALPNNAFHVSSNAHECKQTPLNYVFLGEVTSNLICERAAAFKS